MYRELVKYIEKDGQIKTITILSGNNIGAKAVIDSNNKIIKIFNSDNKRIFEDIINNSIDLEKTNTSSYNDVKYVIEKITDSPRLVIFGAGHVARELCKIASGLSYNIIVVDDRIEFANSKCLPYADELICCNFEDAFDKIPDNYNTYYVIVTRGHKYDEFCLKKVLSRKCIYIGMIGSKSKIKYVFDNLRNENYTENDIKKIHAPIGIDLPGSLPMEVAISIAAELISVRYENKVSEIDILIKKKILKDENLDAVMATIISKTGSSPRDIGSKMLVLRSGEIIGSVGGGSVEHSAINTALKVNKTCIEEYNLSNDESSKLGMVCGGKIEILFEKI